MENRYLYPKLVLILDVKFALNTIQQILFAAAWKLKLLYFCFKLLRIVLHFKCMEITILLTHLNYYMGEM